MNRDAIKANHRSMIIFSIVVLLISPNISYAQEFSGRIDNGTPVEDPELFPWMAALMEADDSNPDLGERQFCGGALIDPNWVLTAGHCVTLSQYAENSGGIIVRLGTTNLADFAEEREIDYFVIHEPTDPSVDPFDNPQIWYYGNDLALLHLSQPSNQAILSLGNSYIDDLMCISMGWGGDDAYPDEQLLQGEFFIDNEFCDIEGIEDYLSFISDEHHLYNCVVEELLSDSSIHLISGDSGGPLIYLDNEEIWRIAGVASWMMEYFDTVNNTNTNVFTRVDNQIDWINNVINNVPDDINITFANRDIDGINLTGTLGVFSIHPEFTSEETKTIPSEVYVNIRTFNETFNDNSLKHHDWNGKYGDYLMNHDRHFKIGDDFDIAYFLDTYEVTIGTNIPTEPVLDFLTIYDPWYRDPITFLQPDYPFLLLSEVAPSGIHKVFLNQTPDEFHPYAQIYKFGASSFYEVSNLCSDFDHWSGNYVTFANPTNLTTTVIITDQGAALTANYNGHGDMDEDGTGTVLDLVILANIILEYAIPTSYQIWAGDLNGDDLIDVADAVILNDNIINGCTPLAREMVDTGTARLDYSQIDGLTRSDGMDLSITVDSDVPVLGVQLEFEYDASLYEFTDMELTEVSSEFRLEYRDFENGITRVVIYPQGNIEIPAGIHDILVVHYSGLGRINRESQLSIVKPIVVGHRGMKLNTGHL